jgi:hypothetical protein
MLPLATDPTFPAKLKERRIELEFKRGKLASLSGIDPNLIRKYEDATQPKIRNWLCLNIALGYNPFPAYAEHMDIVPAGVLRLLDNYFVGLVRHIQPTINDNLVRTRWLPSSPYYQPNQ